MGAMQNEWLTGYLEAILDTGEEDLRSCDISQNDSPAAKYFVATVTGYDEKSLFHSWSQATVARNGLSRAGRLENMCWRIWHLARRKRQLGVEEGRRAAKRQTEEDKSLNEAIEDMSEDLSEAEKAYSSENEIKLARSSSDSGTDTEPLPRPERRLYVVLISLHGLVRGDNMELGRDSDTGGQVKYVVELARALVQMPEVYRVDLLTRQICAPNVDWSYAEPTEMLTGMDAHSEAGESSGAYIVRIPCGPTDKYLPKECLWPYIQEFVDGALAHVLWMSKVLGKQVNCGHNVWPHVIHGHYADAGDIAALLSGALSVPMVLTGHSLGRNKLEQLLKQGKKSEEDINSTYKIMRRIEAEELSLDAAELVITSTSQEINEQWGIYDGYDVKLEKKLRARAKKGLSCHGRYMPLMAVIPPGMDFSHVVVQDAGDVFDTDVDTVSFTGSDATVLTPMSPRADPQIWGEIMKFLSNPHKPMILALARPDPKKNIPTLINAFGSCKQLRELANLTLIMGNREELDDMSAGNAAVLKTMFQLIDKYDLYGQVAYPKKHKQSEVPDIYRLAAKTKGVFVNPALVEPFGLTLIEAAAHGLPLVATKNGGPNDILQALGNGILVDPHDHKSISEALLKLVSDRTLWNECRRKGLKNIHLYSWPEHCRKYLDRIALCRMRHPQWQTEPSPDGDAETESQGDSIGDIRDLRLSIDGERLGGSFNKECAELVRSFSEAKAAGRRSQGKLEPMKEGNEAGSDDHVDGHMNGHTNGGMDGHTNGGMDGHTNGGMDGHTNGGMDGHTNGSMDGHTNGGMDGDRGVLMDGDTNGHRDEVGHRGPVLRIRKRLIIIAVDAYSASGELTPGFIDIVRGVLKDVKSGCQYTGVVLSTSLSISEVEKFLDKAGLEANDFDAVISSSGSELYYPSDPTSAESRFLLDPHYVQHIEYRWGGEGLKKTMARYIAGTDIDKEAKAGKGKRALEEDDERSNAHCLVYEVTNQSIAPAVGDLRMHLRCRGLRCHVVYCQAATKLHLLPLLASRSQALRYFFVRWGVDVARMVLLVGETGDTDYEEMLSGTHKTVIFSKGVETGSETLLRARRGCTRDDFYDWDSPNVITLDEYNSERVQEVVEQVEWKSQ